MSVSRDVIVSQLKAMRLQLDALCLMVESSQPKEEIQDLMLGKISDAVGEAVLEIPVASVRKGAKLDPNSKSGRVRGMCESLLAKGMSFEDICCEVKRVYTGDSWFTSSEYATLRKWIRANEKKAA